MSPQTYPALKRSPVAEFGKPSPKISIHETAEAGYHMKLAQAGGVLAQNLGQLKEVWICGHNQSFF